MAIFHTFNDAADDMFAAMPDRELRAYIDGCHRLREFDSYFERATLAWNNRHNAPFVDVHYETAYGITSRFSSPIRVY